MMQQPGSAEQQKRRLTFILGGARSGKSAHGEGLIARLPPPWIYVATAEARDEDMHARIKAHQQRRDARWQLREVPLKLPEALASLPDDLPVLIDCLTLWLSNIMLADVDLEDHCDRLVAALQRPRGPWVVVSNEVGLGIVPDNALARRFRDQAGRLNARVAALAQQVDFMVAGLAMRMK